jgi:hypothetical protein
MPLSMAELGNFMGLIFGVFDVPNHLVELRAVMNGNKRKYVPLCKSEIEKMLIDYTIPVDDKYQLMKMYETLCDVGANPA